jgi:hypothetical protein
MNKEIVWIYYTAEDQMENENWKRVLPLLCPSGPRRIVHSSMVPYGRNNCLTSSSVCCLLSIPTKSLRSSAKEDNKSEEFRETI